MIYLPKQNDMLELRIVKLVDLFQRFLLTGYQMLNEISSCFGDFGRQSKIERKKVKFKESGL